MRVLIVLLLAAFLAPAALAREFIAGETDFQCLTRWSTVPGHKTRIFNRNPRLLRHALKVLEKSKPGRRYPLGTIVELVPPVHVGTLVFFGEAMVKRGGRFNRDGNGWEFFVLDDRVDGSTEIVRRGGPEVVNLGPPCQTCHGAAKRFDLVCDVAHGCAPLPLKLDAPTILSLQTHDVRCAVVP